MVVQVAARSVLIVVAAFALAIVMPVAGLLTGAAMALTGSLMARRHRLYGLPLAAAGVAAIIGASASLGLGVHEVQDGPLVKQPIVQCAAQPSLCH